MVDPGQEVTFLSVGRDAIDMDRSDLLLGGGVGMLAGDHTDIDSLTG